MRVSVVRSKFVGECMRSSSFGYINCSTSPIRAFRYLVSQLVGGVLDQLRKLFPKKIQRSKRICTRFFIGSFCPIGLNRLRQSIKTRTCRQVRIILVCKWRIEQHYVRQNIICLDATFLSFAIDHSKMSRLRSRS